MAESLNEGIDIQNEYHDTRGSHLGKNRARFLAYFVISILDVESFRPEKFEVDICGPPNSTLSNTFAFCA